MLFFVCIVCVIICCTNGIFIFYIHVQKAPKKKSAPKKKAATKKKAAPKKKVSYYLSEIHTYFHTFTSISNHLLIIHFFYDQATKKKTAKK